MSRQATKHDIFQAAELLSTLRKPKDMTGGIVLQAWEIALASVSATSLSRAVERLLMSEEFLPTPAKILQTIQAIEDSDNADEIRRQRLKWEEDQDHTEGMDEAAKQRANALWQRIKPTLKAMPIEDDPAIPEPEPKQLTEQEQFERIRQIGMQPVQPTAALLKALANPMSPEREG